jgi:hypothetical protein
VNAKVPHCKGFVIKGQCFYQTNGSAGFLSLKPKTKKGKLKFKDTYVWMYDGELYIQYFLTVPRNTGGVSGA